MARVGNPGYKQLEQENEALKKRVERLKFEHDTRFKAKTWVIPALETLEAEDAEGRESVYEVDRPDALEEAIEDAVSVLRMIHRIGGALVVTADLELADEIGGQRLYRNRQFILSYRGVPVRKSDEPPAERPGPSPDPEVPHPEPEPVAAETVE